MRSRFFFFIPGLLILTSCASPVSIAQLPVPTQRMTVVAPSPAIMPTPTRGLATAMPSVLPPMTPPATGAPKLASTAVPTQPSVPTRALTQTPSVTATAYPIPTGNITRVDTAFMSNSLGLGREVIVYLPPGYNTQTQRRYPVLYLLHGFGGFDLQHTTEWEQWGFIPVYQDAIVRGLIEPMIVVQPFGFMADGQCSLFFNHEPGSDGKLWGDYIWKDLVQYIDTYYRTIPRRERRAIGGFSFGGQGALSLGLTHPEVFKVVGAHSPSFRGADGSINFIKDVNWFNHFDPIWLVQNTDAATKLSLWMDVATDDDKVRECGQGSDRCVDAFHELLTSKGIAHAYVDNWTGGHTGAYWQAHLLQYLEWYSSQLSGG